MKKWMLLIFLLVPAGILVAQEAATDANPEGLRADGKIWVVMAVCLTILAGLLLYMFRIDKKITALEREEKP